MKQVIVSLYFGCSNLIVYIKLNQGIFVVYYRDLIYSLIAELFDRSVFIIVKVFVSFFGIKEIWYLIFCCFFVWGVYQLYVRFFFVREGIGGQGRNKFFLF